MDHRPCLWVNNACLNIDQKGYGIHRRKNLVQDHTYIHNFNRNIEWTHVLSYRNT